VEERQFGYVAGGGIGSGEMCFVCTECCKLMCSVKAKAEMESEAAKELKSKGEGTVIGADRLKLNRYLRIQS
jgi:hypothetical protein